MSIEEEEAACVTEMRNLMKENSLLKDMPTDEKYLLRFIYSSSFDVPRAVMKMNYYYKFMKECPIWFPTDGPLSKKSLIEQNIRIMTPMQDRNGRPIYIAKIGNHDPAKTELLDIIHIDDWWMEYILNEMNIRLHGLCVIIDLTNLSWKLMKWCTPEILKNCMRKIDSFPIKEYKAHIVNPSFLANVFIKIVWPFVDERYKKMITFHFTNRETLFDYIDPQQLPPEYGGTAVIDYRECYENLFQKDEEIIARFETYRTCISNKT